MTAHLKKPAHARQAKKNENLKSRLRPASFAATDKEIERWTATAKSQERSFAWWVRNRLLEMERLEQEMVARTVESADSILSHAETGTEKRQ